MEINDLVKRQRNRGTELSIIMQRAVSQDQSKEENLRH